jgi:dipeptidyl aminopeptidase/acylaminoacyl peptidase
MTAAGGENHVMRQARSKSTVLAAHATALALAAAVALLAALPGTAAGEAAAGARRSIRETDLFSFVWVADPQISPDGKRVAFVRVAVNARHDGYDEAVWMAAADPLDPAAAGNPALTGAGAAARPLTAGSHDSAPRWSPDGRRLAFVRQTGQAPPQIFVLPLDGGEARQVTQLPGGAGSPAWSPDGKTLAFTSDTTADDLAKVAKAARTAAAGAADGSRPAAGAPAAAGAADSGPNAGHVSDVRVITRAEYRANGAGYPDLTRPEHLWAVAVPAGGAEAPPARQLTRGEFEEAEPVWAPDGTRLYVISERAKEPYYQESTAAIYAVPAAGGELTRIAGIQGGIGGLAVSPDGRSLAFVGAAAVRPARSYDKPDLWVVSAVAGSQPRNLTAKLDADVGGGLVGDQHPPRGGGGWRPIWSPSGRSLLVKVAERGRVDLRRFDVTTGRAEAVTAGDHEVMSYDATTDGARLALIVSTPVAIGDLFVLDLASGPAAPALPAAAPAPAGNPATAGAPATAGRVAASGGTLRQLTWFNEPLFSQLDLTAPQAITFRGFDGREIEAWAQEPPGFAPGKPAPAGGAYPLILDIHGGPHSAYGYTFFHEAQWMAAKGYVVLCVNPRGSTSYGEEFGNVIQYHFPGDDYKDLMAGVDEMVRRGIADPRRLGVTGGSGGGLLTNWTVTQTERFAAAVSQRSIADWAGWWYTADFTLFTPRWFRAAPFEDPQDFAARSPITYVDKVRTPLMLVEGEADYRTPPTAGGEAMFRALKYLHRPVVMVRFPGESHELSRSGNPWHRVERLQHIARWFDKYLQGVKTDLYDVP